MTSPHPKITAIIGLLLAVGLNVKAMIDGDPTTNPDWSTVIPLIIVCIGLFSARQNSVSTEEATGKTPTPIKP